MNSSSKHESGRSTTTSATGTAPAWSRPLPALAWEAAAAVAMLLLAASPALHWLAGFVVGETLHKAAWGVLYFLVGVFMLYRFRMEWLRWSLKHLPGLCFVLAVALASCFWSPDPGTTAQRAISLVGTTLLGVFIGYTLPPREIMRIFFWTFCILIVSSIVVALFFPDVGVVSRRWTGVAWTSNALGFLAAVATVLFAIGTFGGRIHAIWGWPLVGLSLFTLAMTASATSLVVLVAGAGAAGCFTVSKRLRFPSLAVLLLLLLGIGFVSLLAVLAIEQVTAALGRDPTLTSRTLLWAAALKIIGERPWTGYGYGIVWGFGKETWLPHIAATSEEWAVHAHNGFLQLATELGLPAAIIALGYVFTTLLQAVQAFIRRPSPFALFSTSFVFMLMIGNITEARLFMSRAEYWIMFVAISVALYRSTERRVRRGPERRPRHRQRRRTLEAHDIAAGREDAAAANQAVAPNGGN